MSEQLHGLLVCVNYDDTLRLTLPHNLKHVDSLTVVTTPTDSATKELCAQYNLRVICTDEFYRWQRNGGRIRAAQFNKGRAMRVALQELLPTITGWVLLTDADVILPPDYREKLKLDTLLPGHLYGTCRQMIYTYKKYESWLEEGQPVFGRWRGKVRGFHQLLHSDTLRNYTLPEYKHAGRYDRYIEEYFISIGARHRLPIMVTHIGYDDANWRGRRSPLFQPENPTQEKGTP